jgi:RNA-directed DNA polymerase
VRWCGGHRLGQIMRGWADYSIMRPASAPSIACRISCGWRVIRWLRALRRWTWKDIRRRFTTPTGRWRPIEADGIELFNLASVPVTRYRYRGNTIPQPLDLPNQRLTAASS